MNKTIALTLFLFLIFGLNYTVLAQEKTLQEKLNGEWAIELRDYLWPDPSDDHANEDKVGIPWAEAKISLKDGKGIMVYVSLNSGQTIETDLKVENESEDSLLIIGRSNDPFGPPEERMTFEFINDDHVRHVIDDPDGNRMELDFKRTK